MQESLEATLSRVFGFASFRPGQREALESLLSDRRLLCIQPTGHGKSLLYQLPAARMSGITLVISPLLSLMRDQIEQLNTRFGLRSGAIHSELSDDERTQTILAAKSGELRILFVSPEQADHAVNRPMFAALTIDLLVVDEAHCISTWGHDFRPAYRSIVRLVQSLSSGEHAPLLLALTATANARVAEDIRAQLSHAGQTVKVLRQSARRENLRLGVVPVQNYAEKLAYVEAFVRSSKGSTLVYCATRDHVESVAAYLRSRGLQMPAYHAGFEPAERKALERGFVDNTHPCMVATNALGMGIDKPDLRAVLHFDLPGSITAYYQEMGRAGRDGLPATCVLLFDPTDARVQEHFITTAQPGVEAFTKVLEVLRKGTALRLMELKAETGLHSTLLNVVIAELIEQGYVEKFEQAKRQAYRLTKRGEANPAGALDLGRYERQSLTRRNELSAMLAYGRQTDGCLMATLCMALGDEELAAGVTKCGNCAVCKEQPSRLVLDAAAARSWLDHRTVVIPAGARSGHVPGVAVIDGGDFSPEATHLLATRDALGAGDALRVRLDHAVDAFAGEVDAVVMVPSQRWTQRAQHGAYIAQRLGVPLHVDALTFARPPAAFQPDLENDEQRRRNVDRCIASLGLPRGQRRVLLVDDSVGSLATMREAARALHAPGEDKLTVIPFALVRTRW